MHNFFFPFYFFFLQLLFTHDKKVVATGASVNQERTLLGESTGQLRANYCTVNGLVCACGLKEKLFTGLKKGLSGHLRQVLKIV